MSALDELMSNIHWMIHDLVDSDQIDNEEEVRLQEVHKQAAAELAALRAENERLTARLQAAEESKAVSDQLLKDALNLFHGTLELCDDPQSDEWIWKWRVRYYFEDTDIPPHAMPEDMKSEEK